MNKLGPARRALAAIALAALAGCADTPAGTGSIASSPWADQSGLRPGQSVHGWAHQSFPGKTATQFEPRWVSAGNTVRDLVEITNGLQEGEPVVKAGAFHLKSILVGKDLGEN